MVKNNFTDSFPSHFFTEMYYNRGKKNGGFIYEEKLTQTEFNKLCESYGIFNGYEELTKEIMGIVDYMVKNDLVEYEAPINNCDFIEEVAIRLMESPISTFHTDSKLKDGKYNPLYLTIGTSAQKKNILSCIAHELLHAYENYQRVVNNAPSIGNVAQTIGYYKNPISKTPSYDTIKQIVSYVLYHLTDFERNAYVAQIKGEFLSCDKRFLDIDDALEYVKTTLPYHNYTTIFNYCTRLCNTDDEFTQKIILKHLTELSNYEFKTYNAFTKWLKKKVYEYQRKFNRIIPKIAAESLEISESLNQNINYLI